MAVIIVNALNGELGSNPAGILTSGMQFKPGLDPDPAILDVAGPDIENTGRIRRPMFIIGTPRVTCV